jgi:hypothetical protein
MGFLLEKENYLFSEKKYRIEDDQCWFLDFLIIVSIIGAD